MAAARGFTTPLGGVRLSSRADVEILSWQNGMILDVRRKKRRVLAVKCCCSEIRAVCGSGKNAEECKERILDPNKRPRGRSPVMPFASRQ